MNTAIEKRVRWHWLPLPIRTGARRRTALMGTDLVLVSLSITSAFALTRQPTDQHVTAGSAAALLALAVVFKLGALFAGGTYQVDWRRLTSRDLVLLFKFLVVGSVLFHVAVYAGGAAGWYEPLPTRTMILEPLLAMFFVGGSRAALRVSRELRLPAGGPGARRVLIAGAGDAGTQVARAMREEAGGYRAVGFVDDDSAKLGLVIGGVPVMGNRADLTHLVAEHDVHELWIAMPSAPGSVVREYVTRAQAAGLNTIKIVPGNSALLTGKVSFDDIRQVQLEELLGRDPVQIDIDQVSQFIRGKTVLVTGAAGSIGSEICRQVARLEPSRLVLMDQDETGIYDLNRELTSGRLVPEIEQVVGDVRDADKVEGVFAAYTPDVVFHAAAYKHVPLMEEHPDQAVKTNVFGTLVVAKAARRWQSRKFVLISTDKAVNPSSVMGATKRAAEVAIKHVGAWGQTEFVAVRFGNVLGSRGSVVPVFRDQIARGGPVTVTDPKMRRYFMTIPEAVLLVLQAGAIGRNGEVLVLDMGEPVRILDLARQLIILSGFKPDVEIPIVFTGIRPGEKLFEDILTAEEGTSATKAERVFVAHATTGLSADQFEAALASLQSALSDGDKHRITEALHGLVVTYSGSAPRPGAPRAAVPAQTAVAAAAHNR